MVAFDAVGPSASGVGNIGATTLSWTHTCIGSGTTVLAGVSLDVASGDTSLTLAVTLNGVAMSSIGKEESGTGAGGYLQVFRAEGVAAGAHTIAVTCTGGTPLDLEGGSISLTGGGALGTVFLATGTTGNPTISVTSTTSGNMVVAFTACGNTIASSAQTSRFIINEQTSNGQNTGNAAGSTAASTGSAVTMNWTITSSTWALIAVEILPAAGGGGPPVMSRQQRRGERSRHRHGVPRQQLQAAFTASAAVQTAPGLLQSPVTVPDSVSW